jgi:hypothetical protein
MECSFAHKWHQSIQRLTTLKLFICTFFCARVAKDTFCPRKEGMLVVKTIDRSIPSLITLNERKYIHERIENNLL